MSSEQCESRGASREECPDPNPNPSPSPNPNPSPDPNPKQVLAVVKEELLQGEPIESIFKEFDPEPLGSASIAQVHKGTS